MNEPYYPFTTLRRAHRFEFVSVGIKPIRKAILYTATAVPHLYTVALVDIFADGSADDQTISNNGDLEKILATVYQTLLIFCKRYRGAVIAFAGSTPARTRLFRMAIARQLHPFALHFSFWGILEEGVEAFQPNGPYTGFLISPKNITIV